MQPLLLDLNDKNREGELEYSKDLKHHLKSLYEHRLKSMKEESSRVRAKPTSPITYSSTLPLTLHLPFHRRALVLTPSHTPT